MHEGAVCSEIIDIVTAAARQHQLEQVFEITLTVGPYSCIHQSQLDFYFDIARKGTCMSNASVKMVKDESLTGLSQMFVTNIKGE